MSFGGNSVNFCLSDDGVGFDIQQQHDGMGLDSMRERVESLKGDFSIESEPGRRDEGLCNYPNRVVEEANYA